MTCLRVGINEASIRDHAIWSRREEDEKRGKDLAKLRQVVKSLALGKRLDAKHRDHALVGELKPARDCYVEPDWILNYTIDEESLRLERTGTHSDLFRN